ncbi:hypothetical protein HDU76_013017 [Blyttiomyces sp. JEL0837]|nr:hypothetical protein HDU76_013017 [Blyttiomyces sp. JEL0837]
MAFTTTTEPSASSIPERIVVEPLVTVDWLKSAISNSASTSSTSRIIPTDASFFKTIRTRHQAPKEKSSAPTAPFASFLKLDVEETDYIPQYRQLYGHGDDEMLLKDAERSPRLEFEQKRIEGAKFFDLDRIRDTLCTPRYQLPSPEDFGIAMDELGIEKDDHLVFYDSVGLKTSPRAWFIMRAMGHSNVSVLDGGLPAWIQAGNPIDTSKPIEPQSNSQVQASPIYTVTPPSPSLFLNYDEMFLRAVDFNVPDSAIIIDCRPSLRFSGGLEPLPNLRGGSIPASVNVDWREFVDWKNGKLQHPMEIIRAFKRREVDLDRDLILVGTDGFTPSILFLALEVLGKTSGVFMYDAGWIQWATKPKSPIHTI